MLALFAVDSASERIIKNLPTSDEVIVKVKRVTFVETVDTA